MSNAPIQEIMDLFVFMICGSGAVTLFSIYPPLWIVGGMVFIYWYLFIPIISDGFLGYSIGPCRYDILIHKKNEWVIM